VGGVGDTLVAEAELPRCATPDSLPGVHPTAIVAAG
jgi:hypothetical protein